MHFWSVSFFWKKLHEVETSILNYLKLLHCQSNMDAAPYATVISGSMWSLSSFPKYDLSIALTLRPHRSYVRT